MQLNFGIFLVFSFNYYQGGTDIDDKGFNELGAALAKNWSKLSILFLKLSKYF